MPSPDAPEAQPQLTAQQQHGLLFNAHNRECPADFVRGLFERFGVPEPAAAAAARDGMVEFRKALVHRSFALGAGAAPRPPDGPLAPQPESGERLELLGDAVLNLVVAEYLFERFPGENEGFLTRLRSKMVNGHMLSDLCLELGLDRYVLLSRQVEEGGGRRNRKVLEDAFEAFLGAAYRALGYERTRAWCVAFLEESIDVASLVLTQNSPKDLLAKHCMAAFGGAPAYVPQPQPAGAQVTSVLVRSPLGPIVGAGSGATRRAAEEDAARAALRYYGVPVEAELS